MYDAKQKGKRCKQINFSFLVLAFQQYGHTTFKGQNISAVSIIDDSRLQDRSNDRRDSKYVT